LQLKRIFRVLLIIVLAVVGILALLIVRGALAPAVPKNYTQTVKTGGDIEARYLKNGGYAVSYFEASVLENYAKYEIWYPEEMTESDRRYPVVVISNGTGVKASKAKAMFEHLASWGFIVIGNEEKYSWNGFASDMSLNYLLKCNENSDSIFYRKIDTGNVGSVGHSQGGVGAINTVTDTKRCEMYKTVVAESPSNPELSASLEWDYDLTKVRIPIFFVAGTEGDFEMKTVIPAEKLPEMYRAVDAPKAMARKTGCSHGEMLYSADGYVTAWLLWQLQGDEDAALAFTGENPELLTNALYQGQETALD